MDLAGYLDGFADRDWRAASDGTVRLALIGIGNFARAHALPALENSELCAATALVTGSPGSAGAVAAEFGVDHVLTYDEYEDGEATDAYDAVHVMTPIARHLPFVEAAAGRGKHVLCEKPMESTPERAEAVIEACEAAGVRLMVGYRTRYDQAFRRLVAAVDDGAIGDTVQFHSGFSSPIVARYGPDQWRLDASLSGGGSLINLGIYPINAIRTLVGADPVSVTGTVTTPDAEAFDSVDEHVAFTMTFATGATAAGTSSYNGHRDNRLQVVGTEGQVLLEPAYSMRTGAEFTLERADTSATVTVGPTDELAEEYDHFATCVLEGRNPETDGPDGLADLRVIDAIYEADATGRRVDLD